LSGVVCSSMAHNVIMIAIMHDTVSNYWWFNRWRHGKGNIARSRRKDWSLFWGYSKLGYRSSWERKKSLPKCNMRNGLQSSKQNRLGI
jgi:hypothetical protein